MLSRTHSETLPPKTTPAGRRERTNAVCFVFLQQFAAAAEEARCVIELMYTLAEAAVFLAVPYFTKALLADISE